MHAAEICVHAKAFVANISTANVVQYTDSLERQSPDQKSTKRARRLLIKILNNPGHPPGAWPCDRRSGLGNRWHAARLIKSRAHNGHEACKT